MASVYNSTPFIPSQGNAKYALDEGNFYQFDNEKWDDTKIYTSVILTVSCDTPGYVKLRWTNSRETSDGVATQPGPEDLLDPLARDEFFYQPEDGALTKQYDTRARWLNVWYDGSLVNAIDASLVLSTNYKKAPTEIKFVDDGQNIVNVNKGDFSSNSLYTVVTDMSGLLINTTMEGQEGEALYVHLADASGTSLDTTYQYRDFVRADMSQYNFDNSVNNDDKLTIIPETNEFMLPTDQLGFKHGDIVKFIVLREEDENERDALDVFDNTDTSGYLKARAKVHYTRYDPSFTTFQLLVDRDIGDWFDGDIQTDYPSIINYEQMTTSGDPNYVQEVSGNITFLTICGEEIALVDDYYNIIEDVSGFSRTSINLSPGKTPLDLRFYKGLVQTTNRLAHFIVDVPYDPDLTLTTALRDNCNNNLDSTHINNHDWWFFNIDPCEPVYPRVLIVAYDGKYRGLSSSFSERLIRYLVNTFTFTGGFYNEMVNRETSYGVSFNSLDNSLTGPCHAFLTWNDLLANDSLFDTVYSLGPGETNNTEYTSDDYFNDIGIERDEFPLWDAAERVLPLVEQYNFTDIVFIVPEAHNFQPPHDSTKDQLEHNATWKGLNRYIIAPGNPEDILDFDESVLDIFPIEEATIRAFAGESEDLLHFVDGDRDHIMYFLPFTNIDRYNTTTAQYYDNGSPTIPVSEIEELAFLAGVYGDYYFNDLWERLMHVIHYQKHEGHNALATHPSNVQGHSQAGTMPVEEASFPGVALHYALSDSSGQIIDTTRTGYGYDTAAIGNNALFVHLNNRNLDHVRCGDSVDPENPLDVEFQGEYYDGKMFDLTVSGPLTTTLDLSNGGVNINSLCLVNESPTTVWVKLYDISSSTADLSDADSYAMDLSENLVLNLAVPHLDTREITFARPVTLTDGLFFAASTHHRRDLVRHPPGKETIFINGSYKPLSISLTEFLRRNQDADPDDFFEEQFE